MFKVPERYRVQHGPLKTTPESGNNGLFLFTSSELADGKQVKVIASDGMGWEHVSVSFPHRTPSWEEMCKIKDLFWSKDDCVVQYHPPASEYVNNHPNCLHLWRPVGVTLPRPLPFLVGQ